jgi:hypothetical protein
MPLLVEVEHVQNGQLRTSYLNVEQIARMDSGPMTIEGGHVYDAVITMKDGTRYCVASTTTTQIASTVKLQSWSEWRKE